MIDSRFLIVVLVAGILNFGAAFLVWLLIWAWTGYKNSEKRETGFLMTCMAFTGLCCFVVGLILIVDGILLGVVEYKQ